MLVAEACNYVGIHGIHTMRPEHMPYEQVSYLFSYLFRLVVTGRKVRHFRQPINHNPDRSEPQRRSQCTLPLFLAGDIPPSTYPDWFLGFPFSEEEESWWARDDVTTDLSSVQRKVKVILWRQLFTRVPVPTLHTRVLYVRKTVGRHSLVRDAALAEDALPLPSTVNIVV